ncbi:MAG: hypothetical protein AAGI01_14945, partial [Myxococcota bacterium]
MRTIRVKIFLGMAWTALLTLLISGAIAATAHAQTAEGNLEVEVGADNHDGAEAGVVVQSGSVGENRFGLRVGAGATRARYIGGFAVEDAATLEVAPRAYWNLATNGRSRLGLLTEVGTRIIVSQEQTPAGEDLSVALTTRISPTYTRRLTERTSLFAAMHIETDLAVRPDVELDTSAFPTELGVRAWLTEDLALSLSGLIGGSFGYGGDGSKVRYAANLGLEYAFGGRDRGRTQQELEAPDVPISARKVGVFVDTGWRGYALANHFSHGPEVRAGLSLFQDRLAVGVTVAGRPGPLNPREFTLELEDGQTYKGQSELPLRSDGAFFGVVVAPQFAVAQWLTVELPVSVGQGGYGFYFQNEDRDTPDGRRVSAWENEL